MGNNTINDNQLAGSNEILKATALLYLEEALYNEEYETCPELLAIARGLGIEQADIDLILTGKVELAKLIRPIEAKIKKKGRRF